MTTRREFLTAAGGGAGMIALATLLGDERRLSASESRSGSTRPTHFAPRAKRVIWLFMHGGPSQVDLWDPKPELSKYAGQPIPESCRIANSAGYPTGRRAGCARGDRPRRGTP